MMLNYLETYPQNSNMAMQVRNLLQNTSCFNVWMLQGVGDTNGVLNMLNKE